MSTKGKDANSMPRRVSRGEKTGGSRAKEELSEFLRPNPLDDLHRRNS